MTQSSLPRACVPRPLSGADCVGRVPAPESQRGGGEIRRHGELRVADRLEVDKQAADHARRRVVGSRLDRDGGQAQRADDRDRAARVPLEAARAEFGRFAPSSEAVQRFGDVAAQEVAIHGVHADGAGDLDPLECQQDRLLPPSDEVEDRREVGIDAEHVVELTDLFGEIPCRVELAKAGLRVGAPSADDAERGQDVRLLHAAHRPRPHGPRRARQGRAVPRRRRSPTASPRVRGWRVWSRGRAAGPRRSGRRPDGIRPRPRRAHRPTAGTGRAVRGSGRQPPGRSGDPPGRAPTDA